MPDTPETRTERPPADRPADAPVPRRVLVLLVVLTLVWGTNWPLFPLAVREVSVWTFRAVAVFVSGLALLGVARLRGQPLRVPRQYWVQIALATVCYLVVWNIATTYASVMIPSGQAAVLGFTMPLWAGLFAWLALGQKPTGRLLLAMLLGAGAITALMVPSLKAYADAPLGLASGLLAAIGWAIGTLILKHRPIDVPVIVLTGWQMLGTTLPLAIGALVLGDHQWFMPDWTTIAVIAYITLVPMSIGNACWFAIAGQLPTQLASLSSILVPVVAMLSGALVRGEPLGPLQILAMALISAALALALLRPASRQPAS